MEACMVQSVYTGYAKVAIEPLMDLWKLLGYQLSEMNNAYRDRQFLTDLFKRVSLAQSTRDPTLDFYNYRG